MSKNGWQSMLCMYHFCVMVFSALSLKRISRRASRQSPDDGGDNSGAFSGAGLPPWEDLISHWSLPDTGTTVQTSFRRSSANKSHKRVWPTNVSESSRPTSLRNMRFTCESTIRPCSRANSILRPLRS